MVLPGHLWMIWKTWLLNQENLIPSSPGSSQDWKRWFLILLEASVKTFWTLNNKKICSSLLLFETKNHEIEMVPLKYRCFILIYAITIQRKKKGYFFFCNQSKISVSLYLILKCRIWPTVNIFNKHIASWSSKLCISCT